MTTVKRSGLGRNLSALLGAAQQPAPLSSTTPPLQLPSTLKSTCLQPGKYQPRGEMDDESLHELAESIKKQGLLQPLIVREVSPDRYEIIAGERRWRACQIANVVDIPVIIRQVDDETAMAMALVENLQREDLNVMDQARAMQRLTTEFSLTHQQIADLLSKSRTAVSNYLRLLNLSNDVKRMLECGDLDMGHARCLLILDAEQQTQVGQLIVAKNLSVRETEALVARVKAGKPQSTHAPAVPMSLCFEERLQTLAQQLQTLVKLKPNKAGQGKLIIHYSNEQALEKMLQQFMLV